MRWRGEELGPVDTVRGIPCVSCVFICRLDGAASRIHPPCLEGDTMAGRLTMRHLQIFEAVCACGGVGAAARALSISQPSASQAVIDLEEHFGTRLFDRIGRRMYLTDDGRRLQGYAHEVLARMDELERGMADEAGPSSLSIAASITTGTCYLPNLLRRLREVLPDVAVSVRIQDSGSVEWAVLANEVDLGLIEGLVHADDIVAASFARDELVVVAPPTDGPRSLSPEELAACPLMLREPGSGVRELIDAALRERGLVAAPVGESVSTEAIKAFVEQGLGLSILPERLVSRELDEGRLARVAVSGLSLQRDLLVIRHRRKSLSRAMRELLALIADDSAQRDAGVASTISRKR